MAKEILIQLENVLMYSDIGLGGKCITCGELNSINNKNCVGCNQVLIEEREVQ